MTSIRCLLSALLIVTAVSPALLTAAPSLSTDEPLPELIHVGLVRSDLLQLTFREGVLEPGGFIPYEPQPGDVIDDVPPTDNSSRWVRRDGDRIGQLVGPTGEHLRVADRYRGKRFDKSSWDDPTRYTVTREDSGATLPVAAVYRKSTPWNSRLVGVDNHEMVMDHSLFLAFAEALPTGVSYTVAFADPALNAATFTLDPMVQRSAAIHVNQVGFRPSDPSKIALLSFWLGNGLPDGGGLDYSTFSTFHVIDDTTGEIVHSGGITLRTRKIWTEDNTGFYTYPDGEYNFSKTDVWQLDFSTLERPGEYRVFVPRLGTSFAFAVRDDVWADNFKTVMSGLYHHRSGVALDPTLTDFHRPRPHHPDDIPVYQSTYTLMEMQDGGSFDAFVAGFTEETVSEAWGGYMDAGDWDRRIQHLTATWQHLDLYELFPAYFDELRLAIPEADNDLPDVLDEALFNLDFYKRLQLPDGGVRGGVESAEHPRGGEASWFESLLVGVFAPDPPSSYQFAAVAAKAASALRAVDRARAAAYREAAEKAYAWAEAWAWESTADHKPWERAQDRRHWAAAELYRLTGDDTYHEAFRAGVTYQDEPQPLGERALYAAWTYVLARWPGVDYDLQQKARAAVIATADEYARSIGRSGYAVSKHPYVPLFYGMGTHPMAGSTAIPRAHVLTGERRYHEQAILALGFALGANGQNKVLVTGLGDKPSPAALHVDAVASGQPVPAGIPLYGVMRQDRGQDWPVTWHLNNPDEAIYPDYYSWPVMENSHGFYLWPVQNEYTIHQTFGPVSFFYGYLAALDGTTPPELPTNEPLTLWGPRQDTIYRTAHAIPGDTGIGWILDTWYPAIFAFGYAEGRWLWIHTSPQASARDFFAWNLDDDRWIWASNRNGRYYDFASATWGSFIP